MTDNSAQRAVAKVNLLTSRITTPHGDMYLAAHAKSELVHRLIGLGEMGALQEFVHAYQTTESGNCHTLAFEFTYAVVMSLAQSGVTINEESVGLWSWCMAESPIIRSKHSWIEREGEAIDVELSDAFSSEPGDPHRPVVVVQPARDLWKQYQVTGVQKLSFVDFAAWLNAPRTYPLFSRYPEISLEEFKQMWRRRVASGPGGAR